MRTTGRASTGCSAKTGAPRSRKCPTAAKSRSLSRLKAIRLRPQGRIKHHSFLDDAESPMSDFLDNLDRASAVGRARALCPQRVGGKATLRHRPVENAQGVAGGECRATGGLRAMQSRIVMKRIL